MVPDTSNLGSALQAAVDSTALTVSNAGDVPAAEGMGANIILALVGGIIIMGFLANLIFKVTRIPSVVKLMGIGLILGPVTHIVDADALREIAPIFGKIALLIILFAGGLKLDIKTVIQQSGKAVLVAVLAFGITFGLSLPIGLFLMELPGLQSFILAFLVSGTASSIVIPVVTKLSVPDSIRTLMSIESALSNLFILVLVVIACNISLQEPEVGTIAFSFFIQILVSLLSAVVAGIIWARLMGFMGDESLSYMLTLGFIFLLNWLVDYLGGSGAISILFFGVVLANASRILDSFGTVITRTIGIRLDSADYLLNEFLKGIAGELSFLVTTFFFVYLGILVSFDDLTLEMAGILGLIILVIVLGRILSLYIFRGINKMKISGPEFIIMLAMMPRGLATAVMAFEPGLPKYQGNIPGTEKFPFFAMIAILGSNLVMTGLVAVGENRLKKLRKKEGKPPFQELDVETITVDSSETGLPEKPDTAPQESAEIRTPSPVEKEELIEAEEAVAVIAAERENREAEESFVPLRDRILRALNITTRNFINMEKRSIRSLKIRTPVFWLMVLATGGFATLGILMGRMEILLASMMFSPATELVNTSAMSVVTGDVYMFLKGQFKLFITGISVILLAAFISWLTPNTGIPEESWEGLNPTVLDYLLALFLGIFLPIVAIRGKRIENLVITPLLAIVLFPPLVRIGYELGAGQSNENILNGILAFAAGYMAILVGALLTELIMGVTKHPASELIKKWKAQEVEHGLLHKWFHRLHLVQVLEYVGNFYARFIVIGILSIALFIPLQMTIKKVEQEYGITIAIQNEAKEFFEIPDRSGIISVNTEFSEDDQVLTTIRIHTEEYFNYDDILAFEQKAGIEAGKPVDLRLVQTYGSIHGSDKDVSEGFPRQKQAPEGDVVADLLRVQKDLMAIQQTIPGLEDLKLTLLGFNTEFRPGKSSPEIRMDYLRDRPLSSDTKMLLARTLSGKLGVSPEYISFAHIPTLFQAPTLQVTAFRDTTGTHHLSEFIRNTDELKGQFIFSDSLLGSRPDSLISEFLKANPQFSDSTHYGWEINPTTLHTLRFIP